MQDFSNKKILLGVCGGIAAYKSAYLVRELVKRGALVRVVMTSSAQQFITPLTFQALSGNEVRTELFDPAAEKAMGHIELARWADCLLIAPASANCIAKLANGLADDLLSTLYLVTEAPVVLCPAMNRSMWNHPATQENCAKLRERGALILGPDEGSQACGEVGFGRLAEVDFIVNALYMLKVQPVLKKFHVLITAGPTREEIDPVRFISNFSSGKMGFALAQAASLAGAEVTLVSGPTSLCPPPGVDFVQIETAEQMLKSVQEKIKENTIFIAAAAVADYKVEKRHQEKLKKEKAEMQLTLVPTPDVLAIVAKSRQACFTVGFAAETQDLIKYATEKLKNKNLNMIVANTVGKGKGFHTDNNEVVIITPKGKIALPLSNKAFLAAQIIEIIAANIENA
ncbi:bifunctional phosphopantothenoylcysteine decarboxylase/phosphopantothenate--cysteine ligase CoaBC [Legionella adelaidensis]|nr:bifunctional phosphopantothenoylcysteine decarboxylase/phosphopantothenate--cysteine ligase CoaBC [Legionella adelaidensis]